MKIEISLANRLHCESKCGTVRCYTCNQCNSKFMTQNTLNAHKLIHTGEKKHLCNYCGVSFLSRGQLVNRNIIYSNQFILNNVINSIYKSFIENSRAQSYKGKTVQMFGNLPIQIGKKEFLFLIQLKTIFKTRSVTRHLPIVKV